MKFSDESSSRPEYSKCMQVFWHVCSHARRVSSSAIKIEQRLTEFHLWPSECRVRRSDGPFATILIFLVFQIFFIFPQTFLACSHAHIIDRFNIRIAMFVEPLTEPLPEQTKCVFNFSSFRESDPIVHLRSLFKPMDMAHILNKQFYSSEAKVLLINFNYSAESVVSHDLQAHNKLHCVTL